MSKKRHVGRPRKDEIRKPVGRPTRRPDKKTLDMLLEISSVKDIAYMFERGGWQIPNNPDTWISRETYEELNGQYQAELAQYQEKLEKYNEYISTLSPDIVYHLVEAHYENKDDVHNILTVEQYNALMNDEYDINSFIDN